ncbi:TonB-dependent receptor [uncultured Abyssibacter sp.]|uniref:TonB-dependent receptor n=1 Tax=uncultured Abyssibacter sp. TaxID=2320202 RepID=UPI0032B222BA
MLNPLLTIPRGRQCFGVTWLCGALLAATVATTAMAADDDLDFLFSEPDAETAEETPAQDTSEQSTSSEPEDTKAAPSEPYEDTIPLAQPEPEPEPSPRRGRVIEEIVVTAQKTEQTLQEVPVAVSVVGGDRLRDSGVFDASGIEDMVPNLEMDVDAQSPTIGIRGFSTDTYNVGLEPSVGLIVDDVPLGRTEFIPDGLYDIDRVEVLRGPQGTLFGKNTIAGVLIFGTGEPEPVRSGSVLLTGGEDDQRRAEVVFNQPLTDKLLSRVAGMAWHQDGQVKNSFLDRYESSFDQYAARLKLTYDATDNLQLRLGGQFADIDNTYAPWQPYAMDEDALDYARTKDPTTEDDPYNNQTTFNTPGFVKHTTDLVHLAGDYQLGSNHTLTGIVGHASMENLIRMDYDVSAADLVNVNVDFGYDQDSFELRGTGNFDLFGLDAEYVGGLFFFQSTIDIGVDVALGTDIVEFVLTPAGAEALFAADDGLISNLFELIGPITGPIVPPIDLGDGIYQAFYQESQSMAAFGQVTLSLTNRLELLLGLRVGQEDKDALLSVTSRGLGITAAVVGANSPPNTNFSEPLERRETEVSPKVGLRFQLTDDISTYVHWTRGYKSGGFNGISFNSEDLVFEPERGDSYEVGAKMRLLDGSLALNTTYYHTTVSNMQVVNFNGVSFDVYNAAESILKGFELDATWLAPWDWLTINGALALSTAEYVSYPSGPPTAPQSAECGALEDCQQDLSGRPLPKAPDITASLGPEVQFPLGRNLGITVGADVSYRGEQYLTLDLDPNAYQEEQTLLGARISVGPSSERWAVTLRGSNLTNEKALSFVADHNLYANSYFATQTPTRQLSLTLSANW